MPLLAAIYDENLLSTDKLSVNLKLTCSTVDSTVLNFSWY